MAEKPNKFVIQIKISGRWYPSFWARGGLPVSARAAKVALARAQRRFPDEAYRIKEAKVRQ